MFFALHEGHYKLAAPPYLVVCNLHPGLQAARLPATAGAASPVGPRLTRGAWPLGGLSRKELSGGGGPAITFVPLRDDHRRSERAAGQLFQPVSYRLVSEAGASLRVLDDMVARP